MPAFARLSRERPEIFRARFAGSTEKTQEPGNSNRAELTKTIARLTPSVNPCLLLDFAQLAHRYPRFTGRRLTADYTTDSTADPKELGIGDFVTRGAHKSSGHRCRRKLSGSLRKLRVTVTWSSSP
jgi:hypothetical protein